MSSAPRRDVDQGIALTGPTDVVTRFRFGRGVFDELMNERCSLCTRPHRHVVPADATGCVFERRPHCRPWLRYTLTVVKEVPLPGSLGRLAVPGRRRKGAA